MKFVTLLLIVLFALGSFSKQKRAHHVLKNTLDGLHKRSIEPENNELLRHALKYLQPLKTKVFAHTCARAHNKSSANRNAAMKVNEQILIKEADELLQPMKNRIEQALERKNKNDNNRNLYKCTGSLFMKLLCLASGRPVWQPPLDYLNELFKPSKPTIVPGYETTSITTVHTFPTYMSTYPPASTPPTHVPGSGESAQSGSSSAEQSSSGPSSTVDPLDGNEPTSGLLPLKPFPNEPPPMINSSELNKIPNSLYHIKPKVQRRSGKKKRNLKHSRREQ